MTGPTERGTLDLRVVAITAVVLLALVGASGAWAASTNGQLTETRTVLATTDADLASTTSDLDSASAELGSTEAAVAAEQARISQATSRIAGLESQIEQQGVCIAVQTADLSELRRILALERKNFARTTTKSSWGKARAASDKAIDRAISNLKSAYLSAAAGRLSTANSWLSRSNSQVRTSNRQVDIANKEIKRINAASDVINKAEDAFVERLEQSAVTCAL